MTYFSEFKNDLNNFSMQPEWSKGHRHLPHRKLGHFPISGHRVCYTLAALQPRIEQIYKLLEKKMLY